MMCPAQGAESQFPNDSIRHECEEGIESQQRQATRKDYCRLGRAWELRRDNLVLLSLVF